MTYYIDDEIRSITRVFDDKELNKSLQNGDVFKENMQISNYKKILSRIFDISTIDFIKIEIDDIKLFSNMDNTRLEFKNGVYSVLKSFDNMAYTNVEIPMDYCNPDWMERFDLNLILCIFEKLHGVNELYFYVDTIEKLHYGYFCFFNKNRISCTNVIAPYVIAPWRGD
jgi:hypothetical protein